MKFFTRKNTLESFGNDEISPLSKSIQKNIQKEDNGALSNQKFILESIIQNIDDFKISKKQYSRLLSDLNSLFKTSEHHLNNKINKKMFALLIEKNEIISLEQKDKLKLYIFLYLFINQDLISKHQLYINYQQQFGSSLYFIDSSEYTSKNKFIYQKIPYTSSNILNLKDIMYLYESLRTDKIIPFLSLLKVKEYSRLYLKKKKKYIKNRTLNSLSIPNDENYHFYSQNLKKISEFSTDLNFHGLIPDNDHIDISENALKDFKTGINVRNKFLNYENQEILPQNYDYMKRYNNRYKMNGELKDKFFYTLKSNRDFIKKRFMVNFMNPNINQLNKPLKWGSQRQWQETEGPNFIDPNYIYPGKN